MHSKKRVGHIGGSPLPKERLSKGVPLARSEERQEAMDTSHWLMKAEPNSRIEKGKDVKFSVDDFESVQTTPWEGVRNHKAKMLMQCMKVGDQVLFYHSNCKYPGVAGFAEVSKEAYPDYTAWDPEHPYYDTKSNKDKPKWFMVDVTFKGRAAHPIPLSLFKRIAKAPTDEPPEDVAYIGEEGVRAIKDMALINLGRLSVQPVQEDAWKAVLQLAEKGGWEEEAPSATTTSGSNTRTSTRKDSKKGTSTPNSSKRKTKARVRRKASESKTAEDGERSSEDETETRPKKRKVASVDANNSSKKTSE